MLHEDALDNGSIQLFAAGSIQSAWPLWDHYQDHFIQADGRVVDYDRDNLTTSEGQSYAMFFALVANDQNSFDKIYHWTAQNLAEEILRTICPPGVGDAGPMEHLV